jgi:hypothetical protein
MRDNSIRNERDAEAVMELPTLIAVPWVGVQAVDSPNGKFKFWQRKKALGDGSATVRA